MSYQTSIAKIGSFLLLIFLFSACKKEDESIAKTPVNEAPTNETFYGSPFQNLPSDVNDWVFYEVNLRAFSADGNLAGVTARLDSIKSLGVNIIWLMPIYPIGEEKSINSPYCVKDYTAVGSEYGSLEDLRTLVDAAHQRDMAVILDYVANHTAWDHPWISAHPDWYTQDNDGNIVIPPGTNWQDVADLNFSVNEMQDAQIDALKFWIREANIDGYRCDYANGVPFEFWQRAIDTLEAYHRSNLIMLAEGDRFNHLVAGFDVRFSWAAYAKLKEVFVDGVAASQLSSFHLNEYNVVVGNQGIMRFTTNHDESAWDATPVQLFGSQERALAAAVATTFLGGIPLLYGSQEVGRDRQLAFFSRDPINWNANSDILAKYRQFMEIYTSEPAARVQDLTDYSTNEVLAFTKEWNGEVILVIVNCSDNQAVYPVPSAINSSIWNQLLIGQPSNIPPFLVLAPGEYAIYKQL